MMSSYDRWATAGPWDDIDPDPIGLTEWAHCLYEAPEGEIVLCADCAMNSGREDIEVIDQADNDAPCVICRKSFADQRRESIMADMYSDDLSPDDLPY